MWLDNLKELRKRANMSMKLISDKTNLPERTINRIFGGETDHPRVDTLHLIVTALGGSLNDIFADTNVVVATEKLVEVKEIADVVEAERDLILVENEMLKTKVATLTTELELLKKELSHKEELLALHNYYKTHIEHITKKEGML